jgi:hypothetical protein
MAMPAARAIRYKSAMHANPTRFGLSATIAIADSGKHTGHPPSWLGLKKVNKNYKEPEPIIILCVF